MRLGSSKPNRRTSCKIEGCTGVGKLLNGVRYFPKGYCGMHYLRTRISGSAGELATRRPGLKKTRALPDMVGYSAAL